MSRYRLTPAAAADLEDIASFIAQDSPQAALDVVRGLRAAMKRLADFPYLGHARDDLADTTLRVRVAWSYLIIYRPDTRPVEIVRVIHGARDLARAMERGQ